MEARKYVKLVVKSPVVELVKDLHPNKSIEHNRSPIFVFPVQEARGLDKMHDESYGQLEDRLADDHFPHGG